MEEIRGDLFQCPIQTSLAHCVSEDFSMSKGIAVGFKRKFGKVRELLAQRRSIGQVAFINDGERFVFYLVTKHRYYHLPTYESLEASLVDLKNSCVNLNVRELAIPRIGCGLDKLDWGIVRDMTNKIFADTNVKITCYYL